MVFFKKYVLPALSLSAVTTASVHAGGNDDACAGIRKTVHTTVTVTEGLESYDTAKGASTAEVYGQAQGSATPRAYGIHNAVGEMKEGETTTLQSVTSASHKGYAYGGAVWTSKATLVTSSISSSSSSSSSNATYPGR